MRKLAHRFMTLLQSTGKFSTVILMAMALAYSGSSQTQSTASIHGQIVDQNGAAIPDVRVTLVNDVTGLHRETTTDSAGNYALTSLPLTGGYKLRNKERFL
jgi:protocatechuate 3,4-dioxygenase beta subunit